MRFTIATYNIHKGFSHFNRRMVIHELRDRLRGLDRGHRVPAGGRGRARAACGAARRLAGQAAARVHRRLGLAGGRLRQERGLPPRPPRQRHPVALPDRRRTRTRTSRRIAFESRGPAALRDQAGPRPARRCTASACTWACSSAGGSGSCGPCASASRATVPKDAPLVIAGDFNDWRHKANRMLVDELGVEEVFESVTRPAGAHVSLGAADVPPRPHLRARLRDRRRARALRVSRARACPITPRWPRPSRRCQARAMNRFTPGNRIALLRNGGEYFPALVGGDRRAPSARSGSKPTSSPTTTPGRSVTAALMRAARRGVRCGCWSTAGAPSTVPDGRRSRQTLARGRRRSCSSTGPRSRRGSSARTGCGGCTASSCSRRARRLRRRHQHHRRHEHAGADAAALRLRRARRGAAAGADRAHDAAGVGAQRAGPVPAQRAAAVSVAAAGRSAPARRPRSS